MTDQGGQNDGVRKVASPSTIACLQCRMRKIRCERSEASSEKCKRCLATDSVCQFKDHHRGKTLEGRVDLRKNRKRKITDVGDQQYAADQWSDNSRDTEDGGASRDPPMFRSPHETTYRQPDRLPPLMRSSSSSTSNSYVRGPPIFSQSSPLTPRPKPTQDLREDALMNTETLEDQEAAFQENLRITRGYSNGQRDRSQGGGSEEFDESGRMGPSYSFNIAPNIRSDALANDIIRWDRLETIFNWHMRRVDPHAGLLDPDLHTASYTRYHYPLLFSAITTMSAKARQDPEYPAMAQIHEGLDAFATLSGENSLDRVLARIAMLIWGIGEGRSARKARSRLHRIHQIVTDAIDLSLNVIHGNHRTEKDDVDEVEWRERASRRRTWIQICLIFQTHQSDITQQTDFILGQRIPSSDAFLAECSQNYATVADYRLAASLEIMSTRCDIIQIARILQPETSSPSSALSQSIGVDLANLHKRVSDVFEKWFIMDGEDYYPRGKLDSLTAQDIYFLALSNQFYFTQVTWLWASCAADNDYTARLGLPADRPDLMEGSSADMVNSIEHTSPNSTRGTQSVHDISGKALLPDEVYWFTKCQKSALQILISLDKMKDEEMTLSQDFVYVSASKFSMWLSRYHMWFSPSFLNDTRRVMSNLSRRCMAATSRRGNTLRCYARLMDAIIACLTPVPSPNGGDTYQQGPMSHTASLHNNPHLSKYNGQSSSGPIPVMSTEADAGVLRPFRGGDNVNIQDWQKSQHQPSYTMDTNGANNTLDLGHFLDVEDLRHWEELLGLDLQLGQFHSKT